MIVRLGIVFCPECHSPLPVSDLQPSRQEPELYVAECPTCHKTLQARRDRHGELVTEPLLPA